ncbi:DUF3795 domain-containing protein [Extibacter muris]|nr:DUF3795 domain-containing protein [Extibacter muris]MCQ4664335.1 DUF3795 domain-containing protein [Extibacter muris]MCQ4692327.1 DUF3795 domain-containing protein [Extibacter muris]MCQ4692428.1 DUF3795 domain-containing protein [Extibacter muris]
MMMKSICGVDCTKCEFNTTCKGCAETNGQPFGAECIVALYCKKGDTALRELKEKLIEEIHALPIQDMEEVTELYALKGSVLNIEYPLPNGQMVKFWDDNKIYLGNQVGKNGSDRCYGIAADDKHFMVSEYSGYGSDAEVIVFKRWN